MDAQLLRGVSPAALTLPRPAGGLVTGKEILMYVLGKHASLDKWIMGLDNDEILSDTDEGKPLLFLTQEEAENHFSCHAGGRSMDDLNAFVRPANEYEKKEGLLFE